MAVVHVRYGDIDEDDVLAAIQELATAQHVDARIEHKHNEDHHTFKCTKSDIAADLRVLVRARFMNVLFRSLNPSLSIRVEVSKSGSDPSGNGGEAYSMPEIDNQTVYGELPYNAISMR